MSNIKRVMRIVSSILLIPILALLVVFDYGILLGYHSLALLVVMGQFITVAFVLVTGLSLLMGHRLAFKMILVTLTMTYIVAAISFALGSWAWSALINAGSSYNGIALGNHIIDKGDVYIDQINLKLWLGEVSLLTVAFAIAARSIPDNSVRQIEIHTSSDSSTWSIPETTGLRNR